MDNASRVCARLIMTALRQTTRSRNLRPKQEYLGAWRRRGPAGAVARAPRAKAARAPRTLRQNPRSPALSIRINYPRKKSSSNWNFAGSTLIQSEAGRRATKRTQLDNICRGGGGCHPTQRRFYFGRPLPPYPLRSSNFIWIITDFFRVPLIIPNVACWW